MPDEAVPSLGKEAESGARDGIHPVKWWQWVLVYPGIVIGILGAIPTMTEFAKSYKRGVPFGSSYEAEKQNELWQRNSDCLTGATFTPIKNKDNVEIGTIVCSSGDVLLEGKRPSWEFPQKRWVAWNDIAPDRDTAKTASAVLLSLIPKAQAEESDTIRLAQSVLCQRWVGNGLLLQRIGTPQGCFDQVVNTYNGWVVSNRPAPCNAVC